MSLIFENEACLVKNKLIGESSEFPDDGAGKFPVHRLDTPVSGCLLLAKTPEAARFLSAAFAAGDVEKRYWAITEKPANGGAAEGGELIHWLHFDRVKNKSFACDKAAPGRKKALLRYRVSGAGKHYLFLEVDLVTGRHHQIRAQLAAAGFHIKGDLKYGARRSETSGGIRLHARSIIFPNPLSSAQRIEVKTLPPVMDALWTAFAEAVGAKSTFP